jgi:hypothetical protein
MGEEESLKGVESVAVNNQIELTLIVVLLPSLATNLGINAE